MRAALLAMLLLAAAPAWAAWTKVAEEGGTTIYVDPAAVGAQRVVVARVQLQPLPRMQKAPRHPGGSQPQQALARIHGTIEHGTNIVSHR